MIPGVSNAADIYREAALSAARWGVKLRVSEWAYRNRILTTRSSPEPGVWRTSSHSVPGLHHGRAGRVIAL
jgi:phage terminase large subunit GpA-like protein